MLEKTYRNRSNSAVNLYPSLTATIASRPELIRSCQVLCRQTRDTCNLTAPAKHRNGFVTYFCVMDSSSLEIMAAVPLADPYPMTASNGVSSEFDARDLFTMLHGWVLEVGDICVAPPYRGQIRVLRALLKGLDLHLARMNISHVFALGQVPRHLGDNTLQAVISRAQSSGLTPFLPVRPWVAHPSIEPDRSKPSRIPPSIKTWLRSGGIIHPVPSWNATTNMATFLMYMNVAKQRGRSNYTRQRFVDDTTSPSYTTPFLGCALK